jgi:UDP-N-acetylmuramoyl-tripeptide--D-alanyl-D-alanine ligase
MNLTVREINALQGFEPKSVEPVAEMKLKGISTDSRSVLPGELFIAIRGENFDGHGFVADAFARGAVCAIVDHAWTSSSDRPCIIVEDTTKALGMIARLYRRKFSLPIIAVAGSNGKTTTKEMMTAVLRRRYRVLSTKGNLNNQIGVPQTIFRLRPSHDIAVVEIGTNHLGELKYLCDILEPTHGIITNIGHEHLEFFGDLDGVAGEEGELFKYLGKSGIAFVNADDERVVSLSKRVKHKIGYGFSDKRASIQGKMSGIDARGCFNFAIKMKGKKPFAVDLAVPGKHNMANALAAAVAGLSFRVPANEVRYALGKFSGFSKRMEVFTAGGVKVLNDTYNANSDSVIPALETMQIMEARGKKIVVLADMRELGACSEKEHRRIGEAVEEMGFEYLLTYGSEAKYLYEDAGVKHKYYFARQDELSEKLCGLVSAGDVVLIKGSRGMKMENVVAVLRKYLKSFRKSKTQELNARAN